MAEALSEGSRHLGYTLALIGHGGYRPMRAINLAHSLL